MLVVFLSSPTDLLNAPIKIDVTMTVMDAIGAVAKRTIFPPPCQFPKFFRMITSRKAVEMMTTIATTIAHHRTVI